MTTPAVDAETGFQWTIRLPFRWGQVVYLRQSEEKDPGMVVSYTIAPNACLQVGVRWSNATLNWVYPFELTTEYQPNFAALES
jgi:hypothetical protein